MLLILITLKLLYRLRALKKSLGVWQELFNYEHLMQFLKPLFNSLCKLPYIRGFNALLAIGNILAIVKMYSEYSCCFKLPYVSQKNTTCCGSMQIAYRMTKPVNIFDMLISLLCLCLTLACKTWETEFASLLMDGALGITRARLCFTFTIVAMDKRMIANNGIAYWIRNIKTQ